MNSATRLYLQRRLHFSQIFEKSHPFKTAVGMLYQHFIPQNSNLKGNSLM